MPGSGETDGEIYCGSILNSLPGYKLSSTGRRKGSKAPGWRGSLHPAGAQLPAEEPLAFNPIRAQRSRTPAAADQCGLQSGLAKDVRGGSTHVSGPPSRVQRR